MGGFQNNGTLLRLGRAQHSPSTDVHQYDQQGNELPAGRRGRAASTPVAVCTSLASPLSYTPARPGTTSSLQAPSLQTGSTHAVTLSLSTAAQPQRRHGAVCCCGSDRGLRELTKATLGQCRGRMTCSIFLCGGHAGLFFSPEYDFTAGRCTP